MKRIDLLIELLRAIYTILQNYTQTHPRAIAPHGSLKEWLDKGGEGKHLLNKQEAMVYLDITPSTYYRWIKQKRLRPLGRRGQHHFYESDLLSLKTRRLYRERGL